MIRLVCTDRERHPKTFIALLDPDDPGRPRRDRRRTTQVEWTHDDPPPAGHDPFYPGAVTLDCPRCPRSPQLTPENLAKLAAGLVAAGRQECDLSLLP